MTLILQRDEPLKKYSTFGIGGPARLFAVARTVEDVVEALGLGEPLFVLGKGSNCLFDDFGFDGLVLLNKIDALEFDGTHVRAGAGHSFTHLGVAASRRGLSGLEFASGIPGTVGGAVVMNAGADGRETEQLLEWVDVVGRDGQRRYSRDELEYSYRHSPFQTNGEVVVGAGFALVRAEGARRHQLELMAKRKASQPLAEKSAGCIFRNPVGAAAGALIEQCGLKGQCVGDAQVSEVHGNFLINRGEATASEVRELIAQVKRTIQREKGIDLQEEVRYIPASCHEFSR